MVEGLFPKLTATVVPLAPFHGPDMEVDMPRLDRLPPVILLVTVLLYGAAAFASPPGGPCAFVAIDVAKFGRQPFQNPPNERVQHGRLATTLAVQYTNPARTAIGGCPVTLRTCNGQLVGPTLRLRADDVLAADAQRPLGDEP